MISTRGRYALRVMIDLAEHSEEGFIPMKAVAERQGISHKYLEQIMPILTKNKLVEAVHGKGGGYKLTREPADYKTSEILSLTEVSLASVSCFSEGGTCDKMSCCKTHEFWQGLDDAIINYLDGVTLADFLPKKD